MSSACPSRSLFQCGMENALDYLSRSVAPRCLAPDDGRRDARSLRRRQRDVTIAGMPRTPARTGGRSPRPARQPSPNPPRGGDHQAGRRSSIKRHCAELRLLHRGQRLAHRLVPDIFWFSSTCFNNPSQIAALQRFASDRAYSNQRRTVGRFIAAQTIIRIYEFGFAVGETMTWKFGTTTACHQSAAFNLVLLITPGSAVKISSKIPILSGRRCGSRRAKHLESWRKRVR
jgi:hypothetical protein